MTAPSFVQASTGATDAGGAWTATGVAGTSGNIVILQVFQDGSTSGAVTLDSATNIENLAGTDNAWTSIGSFGVGSSSEAIQHIWIGRLINSSAPTATGSNSTSEDLYWRFYEFSGVSNGTTLAAVIENVTAGNTSHNNTTGNYVYSNSVGILGSDRLALNIIAINDDNAQDPFTGELGGDWAEAVAEYAEASGTDASIGLQIATISTAGSISGGSFLQSDATDSSGVVGFALKPFIWLERGYAQAQALINRYWRLAQAQAHIRKTAPSGSFTNVLTDTFTRTEASGWGSPDTGNAWQTVGTQSVDGDKGLVVLSLTAEPQKNWIYTSPGHNTADGRIKTDLSLEFNLTTGSAVNEGGIVARDGAYSVHLTLSSFDGSPLGNSYVYLAYNGSQITDATYDLGSSLLGVPIDYIFSGTSHKVYVNTALVIDIIHTGSTSSGKMGVSYTERDSSGTSGNAYVKFNKVEFYSGFQFGSPYAQAQAKITASGLVTYRASGQAQAKINAFAVKNYACAQALIYSTPLYTSVNDTFTRTVSEGWGTSNNAGDWTSSTVGFSSVDGNWGVSTNGGCRIALTKMLVPEKWKIYFEFKLDAWESEDALDLIIQDGRSPSYIFSTTGYGQKGIYIWMDGTGVFDLKAGYKGSFGTSQALATGQYSAGEVWAFEAYVHFDGNNVVVDAKTWDTATPSTVYSAVASRSTSGATPLPGHFNFYPAAYGSISSPNFYVDNLYVTRWYDDAHGQAQSLIRVLAVKSYAQAQAKISVASSSVYAQAQAHVKALAVKDYGQALATITSLVSYRVSGQSQSDIRATDREYGQSQADIRSTYRGSANAQADIRATYRVYGQAQAQIKKTYLNYGQAQANIKATYQVNGQSMADIRATYRSYANAQGHIRVTSIEIFGQAQAQIKAVYSGYGQAQALSRAIASQVYGQAQALSRAIASKQYGQAQSDIRQTYRSHANAQALIRVTDIEYSGQAQAQIRSVGSVYGQAQALSRALAVKNYANAQADIRATYRVHANAQAHIRLSDLQVYGQAQARIVQTYRGWANAQATIRATTQNYANAGATILAITRNYAQALATISATDKKSGQANALIYIPQILRPVSDISNTGNWVRVVV